MVTNYLERLSLNHSQGEEMVNSRKSENQLTPKQEKFVRFYIQFGGNGTRAAKAAGYQEASAHTTANRTLKLPYIQQAIKEHAETVLKTNVALASDTLVNLMMNAASESVKRQCAIDLLDRGGLPLIRQSETRHVIEDGRTDQELLASVQALVAELGLDAKIIEGEVIPDKEKATPEALEQPVEVIPDWLSPAIVTVHE
ncbi:MAG: terminase small subunit [Sedimenticola sp.]